MSIKGYMQGYREGRYSHPAALIWRVLWIGPVYMAIGFACLIVMIGWGPRRALQLWEENI